MTASRGLDVLLAAVSAAAWSFAAYMLGSRLAADWLGALLAVVFFGGAMGLMAGKRDRALDLVLNLMGALAWAFAAWVLASRLLSATAGAVLGVAVLFSALASVVHSHLAEGRTQRLLAGVCPGCGGGVASEHQHRRWDAGRGAWLPPLTAWRCAACGYGHTEAWPCPGCPEAA